MCLLPLASLVQRPLYSSLELKMNVIHPYEEEGRIFVDLFCLVIPPSNTNSDVITSISGNSTDALLCIWRLGSVDGVGKGNESEK